MSAVGHFARGHDGPRVCCIGLDGVPYSLLQRMLAEGVMPNLAAIVGEGSLRRMTSVHPWVSSVAWTTLQTGVNPAKHGIYGFVDRHPQTLKTYVPLANRVSYLSVWDRVGAAGKKVIVLNVPVTYPTTPVNGILVAGFLAPQLTERAVYPPAMLETLERLGYRIDVDPTLGHVDRGRALEDICDALEKRLTTFLHLMDDEPWDLFVGIVMETDRLHHFFFEPMEQGDPTYAPAFFDVYRRIDAFLGEVRERLAGRDVLMLMSDHGFCSIRREVFYNRWLSDAGYVGFDESPRPTLEQMRPDSRAYCLDPARIFVNLRGRERDGCVAPGAEYEQVRDEIISAAEALTDPATGERVVEQAYRREELYHGPHLSAAADVILAPRNGFDPKGSLSRGEFIRKGSAIVGMHTFDDAFLYVGREGVADRVVNLVDVAPTILSVLGQPLPSDLDGEVLVSN